MADLFLSYSRRDSSFAAQLQRELLRAGRSPWIDVEGIRPAEDFMQAIADAIEQAQAFVFILSADSVASEICARELGHAVRSCKRLIPVLYREVDSSSVPEPLRRLNWNCVPSDDSSRRGLWQRLVEPSPIELLVRRLLEAVDTDLAWVRAHTRILVRATEWHAGGRQGDLLLRGAELETVATMGKDVALEPPLSDLQRSYIRASLQLRREDLARLSGEIAPVKRMQEAGLPDPQRLFPGERRFDLWAVRDQAAGVGGDLYDFQRLDEDHVLIVVGDVAGKGLAASYFLQTLKTLVRSIANRGCVRLENLVTQVDRELSQDNPEMLFVFAFIALLDAKTGQLQYCCAGCEPPLLVSAAVGRPVVALEGATDIPLCTMEGFAYSSAELLFNPGDMLCVVTDGVTEAAAADGRLYGRDALTALLRSQPEDRPAREICDEIMRALNAHRSGAAPVDDLTCLLLHWSSPAGSAI